MPATISFLKALVLAMAMVALPTAVVMLCCVVTWQGRGLALALGLIGFGPLLWCIGSERCSELQAKVGKAMLLIGLAAAVGLAWQAPDGHAPENARFHSRYVEGGRPPSRFAIGNVLPEIDQIHLGYAAALAVDPLFNRAQKVELAAMTDAIYADG